MMSCWKRNPKKTHKVADALRVSTINIGTLTDQVSDTTVTPLPPSKAVLSTESLKEGEKLEAVVEWKAVVHRYRLLHGLPIPIGEEDEESGEPIRRTAPARIGSSFYVKSS